MDSKEDDRDGGKEAESKAESGAKGGDDDENAILFETLEKLEDLLYAGSRRTCHQRMRCVSLCCCCARGQERGSLRQRARRPD